MINKKYPTNTSEIKNLSKQAKSLKKKKKNHYTSSSIKLVEFFQTRYTSSNTVGGILSYFR